MNKIVFSEAIHERGMTMISEYADIAIASKPCEEEIISEILDADGLVVRGTQVTEKIIDAGLKLKVIGSPGIGVDHIDVEAATAHGIAVINTPEANSISVAEHAVAAMLFLGKRFRYTDSALRTGVFEQKESLCGSVTEMGYTATELHGKTLGLIGFGRIAKRLAQICSLGFQMNVAAYDPYVSTETFEHVGVIACKEMQTVFREADFVSVHTPLTEETVNMINEDHFDLMKTEAYFIHTSRGGVVNEQDLYMALKKKRIRGAAVDVFVKEPPPKAHPLFELDNLLVTPHMAAMTDEALLRMAEDLAAGVIDVLKGKQPNYIVNLEVFNK